MESMTMVSWSWRHFQGFWLQVANDTGFPFVAVNLHLK
jgi:hypothetical protein